MSAGILQINVESFEEPAGNLDASAASAGPVRTSLYV